MFLVVSSESNISYIRLCSIVGVIKSKKTIIKSGLNSPDREDYVLADRGNYALKKINFLEPYGV